MPNNSKSKTLPKRDIRAYDLNPNALIWRYIDLSKFLDLLEHRRLFFVRGDKLEDKFEGSFTPTIKAAIKESYRRHKIDFTYDKFRKQFRRHIYINCWHKNNNDSIAMWRLYGGSSDSVAIVSRVHKLVSTLEQLQDYKTELRVDKVTYTNHWKDPHINFNPYSRVFFYKTKAYEYEKEVRALIDTSFERFHKRSLGEKGIHVPVNITQFIEKVVTAPDAPDWFFELVVKLVKERYLFDIQVLKSRLAQEFPI